MWSAFAGNDWGGGAFGPWVSLTLPSFPLQLSGFTSKLVPVIQNALKNSSGSGREKALTVLTEPILIETYMGLMSFIGNRNKLGYSLARGSIGF